MIFFQQIQLLDKTLRRTLTKRTLDHLGHNKMVRSVGLFNNVKYVSRKTNDPFPVLRKAKPQQNDHKGEQADRLAGAQCNG